VNLRSNLILKRKGCNMERFEQTNPRIQLEEELEQFVAYDPRGKAVVLQKNSQHPGKPFLAAAATAGSSSFPEGEEAQIGEVQLKLPPSFRVSRVRSGNLRFFSQAKEASGAMLGKLAPSRG
jgi:hypothetical protein